jgi:putative copper export protein
LFLHVLGATVWVGGQLVLAGLVPVVRKHAPDATKAVARAFARVAWPAFALAVITGIWNLAEIDVADQSTSYQVTVFVKIALAMIAGVAVAIHSLGRTKLALALGGAIGLLASLAALFVGVLLRTGLN